MAIYLKIYLVVHILFKHSCALFLTFPQRWQMLKTTKNYKIDEIDDFTVLCKKLEEIEEIVLNLAPSSRFMHNIRTFHFCTKTSKNSHLKGVYSRKQAFSA